MPGKTELERWVEEIRYHTMLHEDLKRLYDGFPKAAHAMAVCSAIVSALSPFYPMDLDPIDDDQVRLTGRGPRLGTSDRAGFGPIARCCSL